MIKMSITSLPCVNCGVNLPITKGSTVQCFSCGTTNGYTESLDLLTDVLLDLFGYQGKFEEINDSVSKNTIQKRMLEIDKNFNKLLSESRQIDLIVITKLDSFLSEDTDIQKLRKHLGLLAIIIEQFLVPLLDNDLQAQQYNEMISLLKIRNIQLSGLIFTQKAKDAYQVDDSQSFYYQAQKNFAQAKNYAQEFAKEYHVDFQSEESLSDCAEKFCALLEDFTTNNPAYFADELEELELKLKDLTDARAITLKKQVITFYNLGTSLMFLLEEMREKKPFKALKIQYERIPFYTQEIKEDFYAAKRWL